MKGLANAVVGILAVQGAFDAHARVVRELDGLPRLVRRAGDFDTPMTSFVLPGGESTVQLELVQRLGLDRPLRDLVAQRIPILATCAGLILLARTVKNPEQRSFGVLDVEVARNGWGRQVESFEARSDEGGELLFIRAPRILATGPGVSVLERLAGEPVLVREGNVIAATFHPELGSRRDIHLLALSAGRVAA